MVKLKNPYPTETERKLFAYGGFYLVDGNGEHLRYMPVHTAGTYDGYPEELEVGEEYIEHGTSITFHRMSGTVMAEGMFDGELINLIGARLKELECVPG